MNQDLGIEHFIECDGIKYDPGLEHYYDCILSQDTLINGYLDDSSTAVQIFRSNIDNRGQRMLYREDYSDQIVAHMSVNTCLLLTDVCRGCGQRKPKKLLARCKLNGNWTIKCGQCVFKTVPASASCRPYC